MLSAPSGQALHACGENGSTFLTIADMLIGC
jgi:hypothetical protein